MPRKVAHWKVRSRAIRMYRDGRTLAQIARRLGCHKTTVKRWIDCSASSNVSLRRRGPYVRRSPRRHTREVLKYLRHSSVSQAAEHFGLTPVHVRRLRNLWARQRGYLAPLSFKAGDEVRWGTLWLDVLEVHDRVSGRVLVQETGEIIYPFVWDYEGIKCVPRSVREGRGDVDARQCGELTAGSC